MTGGFYDHRRSKLKFMNMIVRNKNSLNMKEKELEEVRNMLQDILLAYTSLLFSSALLPSSFLFFLPIVVLVATSASIRS